MKQDKLLDRDWHEYARTLPLKTKAFIGGRYVDAASGETFSVRSPIDGKEICKVASCAEVDVDGAVSAARRSFNFRQLKSRFAAPPQEGDAELRRGHIGSRRRVGRS